MRDSEIVAFEHALRLRDRLTERQALFLSAMVAQHKGDLAAADAIWQQLIRQDSNNAGALGNRSALLAQVGRYEEALDCARRAVKVGPFAPQQWMLFNVASFSARLGQLDETRDAIRQMRGSNVHYWTLGLAVAGGDWARADSLAMSFASDRTMPIVVQAPAHLVVAASRAAAGAADAAKQQLLRGQAAGVAAARIDLARQGARAGALLATASGTAPGTLERAIAGDTTTAGLVTRGMWALAAGDRDQAQQVLHRLRARPASELARHGAGPTLVEAWAAGSSGRWDQAVRMLSPAARQGDEPGFLADAIGPVPMRWLVASAHDHLGQADSAAAWYELTLRPEKAAWEDRVWLRLVSSMAHRRLVLLYAHMGRAADAERHWRALSAAIREPDATVRPLIDEARAALAMTR